MAVTEGILISEGILLVHLFLVGLVNISEHHNLFKTNHYRNEAILEVFLQIQSMIFCNECIPNVSHLIEGTFELRVDFSGFGTNLCLEEKNPKKNPSYTNKPDLPSVMATFHNTR